MNLEPLNRILDRLDTLRPTWQDSADRDACFNELAVFLESQVRPGQPFDLKAVRPNPLWMLLEDRLSDALASWANETPTSSGVDCIRQWYSSGVIIDVAGCRLGFDVIPLLRAYDWPDRHDLTGRLAETLDALLITHRHRDHYDEDLVRACLERGKPVYLPETVANQWPRNCCLHAVCDGDEWTFGELEFSAHVGPHVWRDTVEELPVCIYSMVGAEAQALVYGGDADYTRLPDLGLSVPVQFYFLPWRAPNAAYEAGHERQTGTLRDAFELLIQRIQPRAVLFQHCAELEHVHDGFPASFDLALDLKQGSPVPAELLFWGETIEPPMGA